MKKGFNFVKGFHLQFKMTILSPRERVRERGRNFGFTLAEVLITLGIIGVVAALTMPSLIAKHQKQVYYTQFRKAASQLENALQRYEFDHGCLGNLIACRDDNNIGSYIGINNFIDDFSKYFNVTQLINDDNYQEICANYDKTIIRDAYSEMGSEICKNDIGNDAPINTTAFITADGTLYTFARDDGAGGGNWVDINGPSKGPNKIGRDIFIFYLAYLDKIYWGGDKRLEWNQLENNMEKCEPENYDAYGCAAKLLQEGKMNY